MVWQVGLEQCPPLNVVVRVGEVVRGKGIRLQAIEQTQGHAVLQHGRGVGLHPHRRGRRDARVGTPRAQSVIPRVAAHHAAKEPVAVG